MGETNRFVAVFVAGEKHGQQEPMDHAPELLLLVDGEGLQVFYEKRNTLSGGPTDAAPTYVFYAPCGLPQSDFYGLLKDASAHARTGWWAKMHGHSRGSATL